MKNLTILDEYGPKFSKFKRYQQLLKTSVTYQGRRLMCNNMCNN